MLKFLINFSSSTLIILMTSMSLAQVEMSLEKMRQNLIRIDQSIDETKLRITNIKDARFLPDLYFTLAEFYVQKSRFMYSIKVAENESTPIEELDFTGEKRPKLEAIGIYDTILEKFPEIKERDKALFFKAHELRELGRSDEMLLIYKQLIRQFPKSEYWYESQLIIGDFLLEEQKDINGALKVYSTILKKKKNHFTPLAWYKIGWCHINLEKFKKALLAFETSVQLGKDLNIELLPLQYRKTDIRTEALIAMVWPYSELSYRELLKMGRNRHQANIYFYEMSPNKDSYEKVLAKLGSRFGIKNRWRNATKIYYELLRITEAVEKRLDVTERLYVSMKNSQREWPVKGFVEEAVKTIQLVKADNNLSQGKKRKAFHDIEIFARDVATRQHKRAKAEKSKTEWTSLVRDYEAYLWTFGRSRHAKSLQLNFAEALFNLGDSLRAAKEYEDLSKSIKGKKKKELLDSSIQSYVKALKQPKKLNRLELTEARWGLRSVGSQYIKQYPNEKAIPSIRYNIAQSYYDERSFGLAVSSLKEFISLYPTNRNVATAANLILDSYNQREDYKGLIREGKWILENKKIKDSSLMTQVRQIIQQSEMRMVQTKAGEFGSAKYTSNLLALAKKYKGSGLGDQALFEAFVALRAKKDPRAYETAEQLIVQHGNSNYAQKAATEITQLALITADFNRAATYFELYHERYPKKPESRGFLKNAAEIREAMGDLTSAESNYTKLGDFTSAARMVYYAGNWGRLQKVALKAENFEKNYWLGLANYRAGNKREAISYLVQASRMEGNSVEQKDMQSHAGYLVAMEKLDAYESIRMKRGQEAEAVQKKAAALKQLTSELEKVAASGSGRWAIAGLYGLGKVNDEFAQFINKAPIPKGLSGEQKKQYKATLKQQASSYASAASGYFRQCLGAAEKYEVFSLFVDGCYSKGKVEVNEQRETRVLVRSFGDEPSKAKSFRDRLQDDPRNVKLLKDLAQVYVDAKDYAMAELILNRAIEISPNDGNIMAQIGNVMIYQNKLMEAKSWFEKGKGDALSWYGLSGLYKKFRFENKYKRALQKAKSLGRVDGIIHPLVKAVL